MIINNIFDLTFLINNFTTNKRTPNSFNCALIPAAHQAVDIRIRKATGINVVRASGPKRYKRTLFVFYFILYLGFILLNQSRTCVKRFE